MARLKSSNDTTFRDSPGGITEEVEGQSDFDHKAVSSVRAGSTTPERAMSRRSPETSYRTAAEWKPAHPSTKPRQHHGTLPFDP
jgi:hypothetical protein